jgi:hypothetical protein
MALVVREERERGSEGVVAVHYAGTTALIEAVRVISLFFLISPFWLSNIRYFFSSDSQGIERTSDLVAPTLLLEGHQAPVLGISFNPEGNLLASCSFDKSISMEELFGARCGDSSFPSLCSAVEYLG